jgi:hypothetical protein
VVMAADRVGYKTGVTRRRSLTKRVHDNWVARLCPKAARASAAAALVCLAVGCEEDPPPVATAPAEAPAEKKPAVDQKIANAMAAAEASARSESKTTSDQLQPPADGILDEAAAARELPPGSPAQLVLGGEGSAPRLRLGVDRISAGAGPAGKLVVSYRSGGSMMPTIELDLKPKVAASAQTAPASVPAAAEAGTVALRFAVAGVRPAESQPGRLPENAKSEIAKLSGSSVELTLSPSGGLISERHELAGNNPDLEPLVAGSAEALVSAVLPYPGVPVGAGAFWMIKSRETAGGSGVLAYRMVKLTELSPAQAKLTVSTRRYLLTRSLNTPGLPPHHVRRFESEGEATLSVKPGSMYPERAESRDGFMALVTPDDRPSQAVPIQSELSATLSFGP